MTAPTDAVFIKFPNTLKHRAERGRGVTIEDMLQAADQVLESHTKSGRDQMLAAIFDARATVANWKIGSHREALISKLHAMAHEAESQGRVLGNPLLTEVGTRLAAFVSLLAEGRAAPDAKATIAIALHLDAMVVALDRRQDAVDEVGRTLLDNLELTRHTIKAL
jgi:hypothetical protein